MWEDVVEAAAENICEYLYCSEILAASAVSESCLPIHMLAIRHEVLYGINAILRREVEEDREREESQQLRCFLLSLEPALPSDSE